MIQNPRAKGLIPPKIRDRVWIIREAASAHPVLCAAALVTSLLGAALPLASMVATGFLVGSMPGAVRDGLDSLAGRQAVEGLMALAATLLANRMVAPVRATLATALQLHVDAQMEERLMRAVTAPAGTAHLEDPATLDRISMVQGIGTAGHTAGGVVAALVEKIPHWLQGLGAAVIVARFHWWLALLLLGTWLWATDLGRREQVNMSRAAVRTTRAVRRAGYLRDLALQSPAAREIRIFGLTSWLVERFTSEWLAAMAPIWRERRHGNRSLIVSAVPVVLAQGLAYALLGWAGARGEVGLGELALYAGAITGMGISLSTRSGADHSLAHGTAVMPALHDLEATLLPQTLSQTPSQALSPATNGAENEKAALAARIQQGIRFEGVGFSYAGRGGAALSGLDLFVPAGRSLAIVGANGAGKTTLIKLLCGLYDPTSGRITVDDVDLRMVGARRWRAHVSAIFQDFVQYPLSARDNVGFGAAAAGRGSERLGEAARLAGAERVIAGLPRGWDTVLARQFAGGVDLSGGEWQRIALARALMGAAAGADVLILDEPTANLDVRAEAELYDRFLEITSGLTTILISHRFSTVRRADRICVLDHGHIVEEGTHDELLAAGQGYAHMFALQAARFVEDVADAARAGATPAAGTERMGDAADA